VVTFVTTSILADSKMARKGKAVPHLTPEQIKRLRDRAKECRALATIVGDKDAANSYLTLAEAYEALANQEEMIRVVHERGLEESRKSRNNSGL
jgi:hypothetical protein